jgi:hypothetical protein
MYVYSFDIENSCEVEFLRDFCNFDFCVITYVRKNRLLLMLFPSLLLPIDELDESRGVLPLFILESFSNFSL